MSSRLESSVSRPSLKYTNGASSGKTARPGDGDVNRTRKTNDFEPLDHRAVASIGSTDYFEDNICRSSVKGNRNSSAINYSRNAKLHALAGQVDSMAGVFAAAQRQRDEQKCLQEERHNELLLKLDTVSMHINDEIKRVEALTNAITKKYTMDIENMKKDIYSHIDEKNAPLVDELRKLQFDVDTLNEKTTTEKEEIVHILQTHVEPLNVKLTKLRNIVDNNKGDITNKVEEISTAMMDSTNELTELIAQTRDSQSAKVSQFEKAVNTAIKQINKKQIDFEHTTLENVALIKSNIENEKTERTYCEDGITESFGNFVQKLQDAVST